MYIFMYFTNSLPLYHRYLYIYVMSIFVERWSSSLLEHIAGYINFIPVITGMQVCYVTS